MPARVLHLLSQRPALTGSGVTLEALTRCGALAGWDQHAMVGVPAEDRDITVGPLAGERVHPVFFGEGELDFPVPGMSDVMPYASSRFSGLSPTQLASYRDVWRQHLRGVIEQVRPELIHSHHVWLLSSLVKDVAPSIPVITHCHATGLRQMALCPQVAQEVRAGCARNDRFVVLHRQHAGALAEALDIPLWRIVEVGAGYREELFHDRGRTGDGSGRLLYVGKLSAAKGLPWLLEAFAGLVTRDPTLELHIAGSGGGGEAEELRRRMETMSGVVLHGHLEQLELAELMRRCAVCVLPSFYEGLPLVLVEALACGCRLVATELPGIVDRLAPHLGAALTLVPLPRLTGIDIPATEDLPAFVEHLAAAMSRALDLPPLAPRAARLAPFTWQAVFQRVEAVWLELLES